MSEEERCPKCGRNLDTLKGELVNMETGECHFCYEERMRKEKKRLIDEGRMIAVFDEGTIYETWRYKLK